MWCFIRKPLPTKKKKKNSSSTSFHDIAKLPKLIQEFLLPFLHLISRRRRNVFLLFLCLQESVVFHQKTIAHPDKSLFISRRRRIVFLLFLCLQDSVVFHQKTSAHPDTSLFISRRRRILFLSLWKKKCYSAFSMHVGQCGVPLENLCPPRHEPLHKQKKKNSFPLSLEEEILFCFFYACRTVWCSIRKPLPTQTRASSSVEEEEFFSFLFGRRNNILLFLCMQDSVVFHQKTFAHPDTSLFISRRRRNIFFSSWKKKDYSAFSMYVGKCGGPLENLCPPRHEPLHHQKKNSSLENHY